MDPSVGAWSGTAMFGGLLFVFVYFTAVKGPMAGKIGGWHLKARGEGGKRYEKNQNSRIPRNIQQRKN